MNDPQSLNESVQEDGSYLSTLSRSLSLVLDEFYSHLHYVGVSALTGEGVDKFFETSLKLRAEYEKIYIPYLNERIDRKVKNQTRS